jgi:hypothetical protein
LWVVGTYQDNILPLDANNSLKNIGFGMLKTMHHNKLKYRDRKYQIIKIFENIKKYIWVYLGHPDK